MARGGDHGPGRGRRRVRFAQERQRDKRIGRKRRGPASLPTLFLFGAIAISLAGNAWDAELTPWGIIGAILPGVFLLASIILTERQAAEDYRRAVATAAAAEERCRDEMARAAAERAERERREAEARARAEAEETERREAERARREQRRAEREAATSAGRTPTSGTRPGAGEVRTSSTSGISDAKALDLYLASAAAGRLPSYKDLKARHHIGQERAAEVRQLLLANVARPLAFTWCSRVRRRRPSDDRRGAAPGPAAQART